MIHKWTIVSTNDFQDFNALLELVNNFVIEGVAWENAQHADQADLVSRSVSSRFHPLYLISMITSYSLPGTNHVSISK